MDIKEAQSGDFLAPEKHVHATAHTDVLNSSSVVGYFYSALALSLSHP